MKSTIYIASLSDIESIILINTLIDPSNDYAHPRKFLEEQISSKRVLLITLWREIIGYLLYQILWGNTPFLAIINISPTYQRQWHGTHLIQSMEIKLKTEGFLSYISSTERINTFSQWFQTSQSLVEIGSLHMSHGEEIFYRKNL